MRAQRSYWVRRGYSARAPATMGSTYTVNGARVVCGGVTAANATV